MRNKPAYAIASVDSALLLATLLQQEGPMRVTDAAARLGVSVSTAHRLLGMLVHRQFAEQDPATRAYRPGPRLVEIGLAGPIYGLGAAIVSLGLWIATKQPIFAAIAGVGAWINLFNLIPFGSLDGGRAFHALSRLQKFLAVASIVAAFSFTAESMLILLGLVSVGRAIGDGMLGPITKRIQDTFNRAVRGQLQQYRRWLSFVRQPAAAST